MNARTFCHLVVSASWSWISALALAGGLGAPLDPAITSQIMVRVGAEFSIDTVLGQFAAHNPAYAGTTIIDAIESRQCFLLQLPIGLNEEVVAEDIHLIFSAAKGTPPTAQQPLVWAEANYEGQAAEGKTGSTYVTSVDLGPVQYDNQFSTQQLGLSSAQNRSTGAGVVVAVLDTGVDTAHPLLKGKVLGNGYNFQQNSVVTADIGDGINSDGDEFTDEMVGHGTYVAGLVHLVAPDAWILPVTVLDSEGRGDAFTSAEGMFYAIDHGADIINMSLGSTYRSEIISDASEEAKGRGMVVFGSAGNFDTEQPEEYPAMISNALGIVAVNHQDIKASFSNFNQDAFLSAPGASAAMSGPMTPANIANSIVSAIPGGGYALWEGTSFSTALVSGAAALVRAQYPLAPLNENTADLIENVLADSAVPIDDINAQEYEGLLGEGRLNAAAAVLFGPVAPELGDLNSNGAVDGADLGMLLVAWGDCPPPPQHCAADLTGDNAIDGADLGVLLLHWN